LWKNLGWRSIIYLAALASISQVLYEAAIIEGAGRWKQTLHITIPGISPTIIILLILRIGQMMTIGFEKIILLYNPLTYETADVISSFVYRKGIIDINYSYASAVDEDIIPDNSGKHRKICKN
jgi:putative aldouronate transport system permease protein